MFATCVGPAHFKESARICVRKLGKRRAAAHVDKDSSWGKKKKEKQNSCVSAECLSNDAIHQIPDSAASLKSGHGLGCTHPRAGNEAKRDVQTYWYHREQSCDAGSGVPGGVPVSQLKRLKPHR